MPLLLEDVRLRLPLPHQQLPQATAAEGEPLPGAVHRHAGDTLIGNTVSRGLRSKAENRSYIRQAIIRYRHTDKQTYTHNYSTFITTHADRQTDRHTKLHSLHSQIDIHTQLHSPPHTETCTHIITGHSSLHTRRQTDRYTHTLNYTHPTHTHTVRQTYTLSYIHPTHRQTDAHTHTQYMCVCV